MNVFKFTKQGEKEFNKLDQVIQKRVINKLKLLKKNTNIEVNLKALNNFSPATHRIRIGNIRVILKKISENEYYILDIGNRGDIYK